MENIKQYKFLLEVFIFIIAVVFLFFYNMYRHDVRILQNFVSAYESFDRYPSDDTLIGLVTNANFKISSLIKNDKLLTDQAHTIGVLAGEEIQGMKNIGDYGYINKERKAAYARFQELLK